MVHPKLNVHFDNITKDIDFVYRAYLFVIRFLQLIRYDLDFGHCTVELLDGKGYHKGKFYDLNKHSNSFVAKVDTDYRYLKAYVGKILQFSADNLSISLNHLPSSVMRFSEDDYSSGILVSLFGAFESEYKLSKDIYGRADISRIKSIKSELVLKIEDLHGQKLTNAEKAFIDMAKSRINDIGVEFGQTKKIQKVYEVLFQAFQLSIDNIFYLFDKDTRNEILKGKLNRISVDLVDLRAKAAHGEILEKYSAEQAQEIIFLEILIYAQMLKRIGFDNIAIEIITGVIFKCNFKYQEIELND